MSKCLSDTTKNLINWNSGSEIVPQVKPSQPMGHIYNFLVDLLGLIYCLLLQLTSQSISRNKTQHLDLLHPSQKCSEIPAYHCPKLLNHWVP